MGEQNTADTFVAANCSNVGVTDKGDVFDVLNAHDADKLAFAFVTPENHTFRDRLAKLFPWHIRIMITIGGDNAFVSSCGVVYDRKYRFEIFFRANTYHISIFSKLLL